MLRMKLSSVAYHRNGVRGDGFYAVAFTCRIGKKSHRMVAIADYSDDSEEFGGVQKGKIAILDADMAANGNVKFGENSWRYEDFADQVFAWIRDYINRSARRIEAANLLAL